MSGNGMGRRHHVSQQKNQRELARVYRRARKEEKRAAKKEQKRAALPFETG
jgi:hypothetical protein